MRDFAFIALALIALAGCTPAAAPVLPPPVPSDEPPRDTAPCPTPDGTPCR